MTTNEQVTLKARIEYDNTISVIDTTDGISVWTPNEEVQELIQASDTPKEAAVEFCKNNPS